MQSNRLFLRYPKFCERDFPFSQFRVAWTKLQKQIQIFFLIFTFLVLKDNKFKLFSCVWITSVRLNKSNNSYCYSSFESFYLKTETIWRTHLAQSNRIQIHNILCHYYWILRFLSGKSVINKVFLSNSHWILLIILI